MRASRSAHPPLESAGRTKHVRSLGAMLSIGALFSQHALAAGQQPLTLDRVRTVEARVAEVDLSGRKLVLRSPSGERTVYPLATDVQNLDRVHIGDRVVIYYYMAVAAELKPASEPLKQRSETTSSSGKSYLLPQGTVRRTITTTVEFESFDPNGRTITFKRPDGASRTVKLRDDKAVAFARQLKAGDRLGITYIESTAYKVTSK